MPERITNRRRSPSVKHRARLSAHFHGGRCVVTGDQRNTHWHHLDDNPANASYGNFLPIGSELNTSLRDAARQARSGVAVLRSGALRPDALSHMASVWHAKWLTGLAYGCARLSFYIATSYEHEPVDIALRRACDACYYLRHRFDGELLEDVFARDILARVAAGRARHEVGPRTRGMILSQVATTYSEFGMSAAADQLFRRVDDLSASDHGRDHLWEAALLRRRAMLDGALGENSHRVDARLRESLMLSNGDRNAELSARLTRAWFLQQRRDWAAVRDELEPLYQLYRPRGLDETSQAIGVSAWNLGELFYAYASALAVTPSERRQFQRAMVFAAKQFALSGARPCELVPGHGDLVVAQVSRISVEHLSLPSRRGIMSPSLQRTLRRIVHALDD